MSPLNEPQSSIAAWSYLDGMRESKPEVCWAIIDSGERVCILDRGHDDGAHENAEARSAATQDDYPGAVWHGCARLADDLTEFAAWLEREGADVQHDPIEAARLCVDRWDGLDLAAICAALSGARDALDLLIGRDDA